MRNPLFSDGAKAIFRYAGEGLPIEVEVLYFRPPGKTLMGYWDFNEYYVVELPSGQKTTAYEQELSVPG